MPRTCSSLRGRVCVVDNGPCCCFVHSVEQPRAVAFVEAFAVRVPDRRPRLAAEAGRGTGSWVSQPRHAACSIIAAADQEMAQRAVHQVTPSTGELHVAVWCQRFSTLALIDQ